MTALKGTNSRAVYCAIEPRERRLARAGRSPEDHRAGHASLDRLAQRLARREQMLLSHELVERPRTHARRQGLRRLAREQRFAGIRRRTRARHQSAHPSSRRSTAKKLKAPPKNAAAVSQPLRA